MATVSRHPPGVLGGNIRAYRMVVRVMGNGEVVVALRSVGCVPNHALDRAVDPDLADWVEGFVEGGVNFVAVGESSMLEKVAVW